jgi:hypothetical protein
MTTPAAPASVTPADLREAADFIQRSASAASARRAARVAEWLRAGAAAAESAGKARGRARLVLYIERVNGAM